MEKKHAFLVMAHNDFPVLIEILKALDHERSDIFLHIDKKTVNYPEDQLKASVKRGSLYFIPRMNVSWGGYSQIECEYRLMKYAIDTGKHMYYHMMTGATFPLKEIDDILGFYDEHLGYEFIGYDNSHDYSGRVKKYNLFNEIGKATTRKDLCKAFVRNKFRGLQGKIGWIHPPARGIEFKKGFVYWSLTESAVRYALEKYEWTRKVFKHSFCGDELFMQTIIYNSPYEKQIYNYEDEYKSCMRYVKPVRSWNPTFSGSSIKQTKMEETGITIEDLKECMDSEMLFGFKFVGQTGLEAIKKLREIRKVD